MDKEKSIGDIRKEVLEDYYWETNSPRHHPVSEHNIDIDNVFCSAFREGREQGIIRTTNIDLAIIDEWAKEDGLSIMGLKERISGEKCKEVAGEAP